MENGKDVPIRRRMVSTLVRTRCRHSAHGLTKRKLERLRELAHRWQEARAIYIRDYSDPQYLKAVFDRRHQLVESRRALGWAPVSLQAHQHKTAMDSALLHVAATWVRTLNASRTRLLRGARDRDERQWIAYVLASPGLAARCLDRAIPMVPFDTTIDALRLAQRVRKAIQSEMPKAKFRRGTWFVVDCQQYRPFSRAEDKFFRSAWIAVTSLTPGRRINVPLAGRDLSFVDGRHNLQVRIERDRVLFLAPERIEVPVRINGTELGVDKGYSDMVTVSEGDPAHAKTFGAGIGTLFSDLADKAVDAGRQRTRLSVYHRDLAPSDPKARRIRRANLGVKKRSRRTRLIAARLKSAMGKALNDLFSAYPHAAILHVEDLTFTARRRRYSRKWNARLTRWRKGYLQRYLTTKAQANGVRLNVVHAAWTSLTCCSCGFPSKQNRDGQRFLCTKCGYSGSADAVAATNILIRGREGLIPRHWSKGRVLELLFERWRSAPTGGARGSNSAGPVTTETSGTPGSWSSEALPKLGSPEGIVPLTW